MRHRPYPKIAQRVAADAVAGGGTWVATEKIHGAQLVVATDGTTVCFGKRKAWLADTDPFFGWQLLRSELEAAVRAIHVELGGVGTVRAFGELFGGAYPHAAVGKRPGASAVQTGVWYAPDVRFALFDVLIEADDDDVGTFLAHRELEALPHGLFLVPVLARATRSDLDRLPVRFLTHVPRLFSLPTLADNVAEGFVLKPDLRLAADRRPIIKRKIPEFDDQRFDESTAWDPDARLTRGELTELASRLVNDARIASARSKVGDASRSDLYNEVVLDVMLDLDAVFPQAMRALSPDDEEQLRRDLLAKADDFPG